MYTPVVVGAMIHRNRAQLVEADKQLAEIGEMMPLASGALRRQMRQLAWEVRWIRRRLMFVGWLLRRLDPR